MTDLVEYLTDDSTFMWAKTNVNDESKSVLFYSLNLGALVDPVVWLLAIFGLHEFELSDRNVLTCKTGLVHE